MWVNNFYCRYELSVTASGTRECEAPAGVVPSKHSHHGPFLDHQTSQLHPIITNTECLLHIDYSNSIVGYCVCGENLRISCEGFPGKSSFKHRPPIQSDGEQPTSICLTCASHTIANNNPVITLERLVRLDNVICLLIHICFPCGAKQNGYSTSRNTYSAMWTHAPNVWSCTQNRFLFTTSNPQLWQVYTDTGQTHTNTHVNLPAFLQQSTRCGPK